MDKAGIANRLIRAGLRAPSDAYREEVRQRIARQQGGKNRDREEVSLAAWQEMWDVYRPVVEKAEAERKAQKEAFTAAQAAPEPVLAGIPEDIDSILDPEYSEPDPGKQLRDGLLWAAMEWVRVIRDTDSGPSANIEAASTPPPNAFALLVLDSYALAGADKRRELVGRALGFACKAHDPAEEPDSNEADGFLESIS
jgi:hypothetical protein